MCASDTDYALRIPGTAFAAPVDGVYTATIEIGTGDFVLPFPFCSSRITAMKSRSADYVQLRDGKQGGRLLAGTMPGNASLISVHMVGVSAFVYIAVLSPTVAPDLYINFTHKRVDTP